METIALKDPLLHFLVSLRRVIDETMDMLQSSNKQDLGFDTSKTRVWVTQLGI